MLSWLLALAVGVACAVAAYAGRRSAEPLRVVAAALRAIALTVVAALSLNAVLGARTTPPPLVVLDVSSSWLRGRDSSAFAAARRAALAAATDTLLVFGDSLRGGSREPRSTDQSSRIRPAAERAMASGRPLVVFTDGEIDDPEALSVLPSGSRIVLPATQGRRDAAVTEVAAPRIAAAGDTIETRITIAGGSGGAGAGRVQLELGGRRVASAAFDSLPSFGERTVVLRFVAPPGDAPTELRASVESSGDGEPGNDHSSSVVELTSGAAAVLVSTSPDLDARELAALLRGTVSLPTRAYFRVAPGQWREDGTLAAVSEEAVRRAVREAPIVVLHGDTALFGPPRAVARGALALVAPPAEPTGEWFATGAPLSPVSTPLSGTAWDSLPPLDVSAAMPPNAEFEILETRRVRRLERRVAIVGWERPRRVVVAGATGFWRWRFRGGAGNDAYTAVWGSVLDWLAGERSDVRAAFPAAASVRAGDAVTWRRGAGADSLVRASLVRRGGTVADTVSLRFGAGSGSAESSVLPPGVYDVETSGGKSLLVVNPSRELLPRRPTVKGGAIGSGAALGDAPRARDYSWLFALALIALCAEWLLRRRLGLR